ncbi:XdhC family protein [Nitrogeniibacter mangrovi]|uniref:XdhC family protein n=1 Tax=Nitrogeniibacter mangrovi TaxID=2016596 RepID=A0A6C1B2M7_9RHOO|nr:XdhC family protein [Nitrogeniibacter mangrovi]QID17901.1 XdhC family protein [Nitrogeniibacter mangrovi]
MDSLDKEVLGRARQWLHEGHRVLLATVVRTWGSSPRPPGALVALRDDGHAVGSVSGGCIEDDLIRRLADEGMPAHARTVSYGVSAEEARRFGLPCGGTMELVLEPLGMADALDALIERIDAGALVARTLDLASGRAELAPAHPEQGTSFDGRRLVSVFGPRYRLLIIGAGQLSAVLARMALALDFAVTVCDPRAEWADEWEVAGTTLSRLMPDDLVIAMRPDARMAVVALTHDPKLDDLALMEALRSPAFYVAALGSRRNNAQRRERLREFDVSEDQVAALRGPAGLYIGSRTPAEIAVSIAAELVAVKNGVTPERVLPVGEAKAALEVAADALSACRK